MLKTLLTLLSSVVLAVTNPASSGDITNSATIGATTQITAPILIAPVDDSLTNNRYETFSWNKSTPDTNVSHYTLYLNGVITASFVNHNPTQDTSTFTATATDGEIYLNLKTPIQDGKHTWYIIAYSNDGISAISETRTFYVDATIPIIILQAVDKNTMYWASNDPYTIPTYQYRHLIVTTKNPLLSGKIEALSNFKLSLVCPRDSTTNNDCIDQTITINDPDGNWEHRFRNLVPNITYTAYLSATDAANTSNIFPEFTLTYTPTPLISIFIKPIPTQPTPTTKPISTPSLSPEIKEEIHKLKQPPPPPSFKTPQEEPQTPTIPTETKSYLICLALFGLLLHISMVIFGAGIRLKLVPKALLILFYPLSQRRPYHTNLPFITVLLYDPDNQKLIYSTLSNLENSFDLPNSSLFLKATHPGYEPYSILMNTNSSHELSTDSRLVLRSRPSLTTLEGLQNFSLGTRSLPLGLSILSAIISLISTINLPAFLLLITGLDLLYTQYIYPSKN